MKWNRFTSDPAKREQWIKLIGKGRENFQPGKWTCVCSNHFIDAEPTTANPNPTLTISFLQFQTKKKNKKNYSFEKKESSV